MRFLATLLFILITSTTLASSSYLNNIDRIKRDFGITNNITIVEDPTINAYTNGLYIAIHSGLLNMEEANYESLAVIIAHELGHVNLYHIWKRKVAAHTIIDRINQECNILGNEARLKCTDRLSKELFKYIRDQEVEADDYAFNLGKEHKFNATQACSIYRWMANHDTTLDESTSDHPLSRGRYEKCLSTIGQ
jgi:predicted Zn-dependent protease